MKIAIPMAFAIFALSAADSLGAQPYPNVPVPNLNGTWYMNGDINKPTRIIQRQPDGNALFINEKGSQAWGSIDVRGVWVPDWSDGLQPGLQGSFRGNQIIWANSSFWSRTPGW